MTADTWTDIGRMDELGRMDSPVHRLDARTKALVTSVFIGVVMSFPRYELSALTPFLLYPVALAAAAGLPARDIVKRLLVAAPLALVVGIFNPLLDRQPALVIGSWPVSGGWLSFASIMLRFAITVSAALVLVACTGMYRLGAGMERLGVPRVFVVQLLFLYRYLFVIADEGHKVLRAAELRSGGTRRLPLRVYGSLVGRLLLRSMDRAERVYRAMVARGFDGEIRTLRRPVFRAADWLFAGACLVLFAIARTWNLAELLGQLFAGQ